MSLPRAHSSELHDGQRLWHAAVNGVLIHHVTRSDVTLYVKPFTYNDYLGADLVDGNGIVHNRQLAHRLSVTASESVFCQACGRTYDDQVGLESE